MCLLGDIGLAKDEGLFIFLEKLLAGTPNLKIFYVMGNHEPYQISIQDTQSGFSAFEKSMTHQYDHRFILLDRKRFDSNETITVLGCTLWTSIMPSEILTVSSRLTDWNEIRGIKGWSVDDHLNAHKEDLTWLNQEVQKTNQTEPDRQIAILTYHSLATDPTANNSAHTGNDVKLGFVTDLSSQSCWTNPQVKLWAFGHNHYSCSYRDEANGKLVVSN
ncbi:hypothetical protein M501DRAFT_1020605 [Patellaria atrata CBS 101060]|uniref:Calcineurin-like phosphoesterase domain-containing protein n=1 Tax=Patellaria atrata CBS 101060 TaxID=1346257 RepID=A0A9P4S2U0_9PEZI|nr:hypothetical protein M501DRAFT_1020605 [Patellaria atrata CBS 101060]